MVKMQLLFSPQVTHRWGRSLCYQLPGLMLTSEGLTLVVSPILALMKDQVNSMKALGHPVDLLASILALGEKIAVKHRVRNGYVAPEQLNNENTLALIQSISISLLAIDEAHRISEMPSDLITCDCKNLTRMQR
mmetsp:Transcript_11159/g.16235  ORF Transcript_11159/g.16235 Transcript_11159/m.16235 type:complete len:134 (-) Transcript_11159:837-1238(-)